MTVENGTVNNGDNISLSANTASTSQKFILKKTADNTYAVLTLLSNGDESFDVFEISTESGANICQWEYWGGVGQQFIFNKVADIAAATTTTTTTTTTSTSTTTSTTTTTTTSEPVTTTTTTEPKPFIYGDANDDGAVDVADATLIMQAAAAPSDFSVVNKEQADVTGGGDGVTAADALVIQRYLSGTIAQLPA